MSELLAPGSLLTGVTLTGLPQGGPTLQFRCRLASIGPDSSLLLEQITQPRSNPDWLIKYLHPGAGILLVKVEFRTTPNSDWRDAGEVSAEPGELLRGKRSAVADLPLKTCRFAPDLQVRLQFNQADPLASEPVRGIIPRVFSRSARSNRTASPALPQPRTPAREGADAQLLTAQTQPLTADAQPMTAQTPALVADVEILPATTESVDLTSVEQVIIKDTWNKLLGFHEMLLEMFFERLLHEEPDLVDAFGDSIDSAPDDFGGLFDYAVRGLQPGTENILRESYRNLPGLPNLQCGSADAFIARFTSLGMLPRHWLKARKIWMWMLGEIPYLEEYERENLRQGKGSAAFKFFTSKIMTPAEELSRNYHEALTADMVAEMARCGAALAFDAKTVGIEFYHLLFLRSPEVIRYFGRSDMDHLADHLFKAIAFLTQTLQAGDSALDSLRRLAAVHTEFMIPPEAYAAIGPPLMEVMRKHYLPFNDRLEHAWNVLLERVTLILAQPMINQRRLLDSARKWLDLIAGEQEWSAEHKARRWGEITREIVATSTYTHTYEELAYGAQVAWRNAPKCIARISWRNMIVRDLRHITDPDEMFRETLEHVRMGVNGGNMQIVMNVFRPKRPRERWGPRIWNSQYLRYAGYRQTDGSIIGDGANVKLTEAIERLGWQPPQVRGSYDLLPLVIEVPGQQPRLYEFGEGDAIEVAIEHPTVPAFASLGLKWVVIPAISNFRMDIGGIQYGCIPFNGWFMETEIARNLWEPGRYNQAENIARALGLDTSTEQTLWRDRAFLELNVAVLHSFSKARVSLVDHQTAAKQFLTHDLREKKAGRECPAQWSWVVPAAGGSTTQVWHHEMRDFYLSPHYHYAADKWAVLDEIEEVSEAVQVEPAGASILILYGSETGTAEGMARQAARRLHIYRPKVMALNDCDPQELVHESFVLVVTSTFGEGDVPSNARRFEKKLKQLSAGALTGLNYSVLALGSTVYPHFCAAGVLLDHELARVGAHRAIALHRADEIKGQIATFDAWLGLAARLLGEDPAAAIAAPPELRVRFLSVPSEREQLAAATHKGPGLHARVVANRELLKEIIPGSRSTRFIALDLGESHITYETGDHLFVYPKNSAAEVDRLCARLKIEPDAWFNTSLVGPAGQPLEGETAYPHPSQVRRVLTEDFDLCLREPLKDLLTTMARHADSVREKAQLSAWVETFARTDRPDEASALSQSIIDEHVTVADLLLAFPSTQMDLAHLLELLPRQKPRLYSISSSNLTYPNQVQITIGVVQVKTAAGKVREGVCSNFLASLDPSRGDRVRISVRRSTFRPPTKLQTPMLMVGPGTGLSPLIGFLQHRGAQLQLMQDAGQNANLGDARLYFGCRDQNDYLYQEDLEAWRDNGLISHLAVAFSRASEGKAYVQHLLAEHGPEIWQVLSTPNCHYYICGDAKMADDVFDALMKIAQTEGRLARAAAVEFFDLMKAENRYHADVWGVTLNFEKAIKEIREAKYNQGERWFQNVTAAQTRNGDKSKLHAGRAEDSSDEERDNAPLQVSEVRS